MNNMRSFLSYLVENSTEDKLKHLEHPEDHILKSGEAGFHHAFETLKSSHEALQGQDSGTALMTKYDGAPSVVFGHHPETGRFFVASKSAWNKNPKLNYTEADIEANHGHAPGLVAKLKAALHHLPKVAPKKGVYQGDFLYDKDTGDVQDEGKRYSFKPQLIRYSTDKNSAQGKQIARSRIGFYVHTGYKGNTLEGLQADYRPDLSGFKQHPDVHLHRWDQGFNAAQANYTPKEQDAFRSHMNATAELFKQGDRHAMFGSAHPLGDHLTTYINSTVRTGERPTVAGLRRHVQARAQKDIDSVKTDKSKQAKQQVLDAHLQHIDQNSQHLNRLLQIHHHLQQAKGALMPALQRGDSTGYDYSINDQPTGPEGFVAVTKNNRPSKFVDRGAGGFAQANLSKGGFGK